MGPKLIGKTFRKPLRAALLAAATVVALAAAGGTAMASQIFVQASGTSAAGGHPNLLTNPGSFVIGQSSSVDLQQPLLVIVGVYNGNQNTARPTLSHKGNPVSAANSFPFGPYGLTAAQDTFTGTSGVSAFRLLGLSTAGNTTAQTSESFKNWATGDTGIGLVKPSSFELFAYQLSVEFKGPSTINVGVSGAPVGSYVIAYACRQAGNGISTYSTCESGKFGATVFTNTGLIDGTNVPEPGSLALLGTGVIGLGFALRRRRRS